MYVAIEINKRSEERRIYLYEKIQATKSIIEEAYGASLVWNPLFVKENDIFGVPNL